MAGDRTLTLKILGDTKQLVDSLNKGAKGTESFTKQIGDLSAKVVKSFVAIGTAVGALSIAFAKAAAEDEQAANRLAQTLQAVTAASQEQIKAVETFITQVAISTGITDDELRPAFERLARSTNDVSKAQDLLNLALDLSAATSLPLQQVTSALGKAYDGNYTALNKLGLGIDQTLIKSKDFDAIQQSLNATFGEFSEKRSEEALIKFQRLQVAFDEAKEAVGAALLPAFERLGDWLLNEGVPRLESFIAGLTGEKSLSSELTQAQKDAEEFGRKVRTVIETIISYKNELIAVGVVAAGIFVATKIAAGVQATIMLIKGLITVYNALRVSAMAAGIAAAFALNPALGIAAGAAAIAGMGLLIQQMNKQSESIGNLGSFESMSMGGVSRGEYGTYIPSMPNLTLDDTLPTTTTSKKQKTTNISQVPTIPYSSYSPELDPAIRNALAARNVTINVNAPSVIDEVGFTRAVVDAMNSVERTSAGGYSALFK